MESFTVVSGRQDQLNVTLLDSTGSAVTSYTSSDVLTATVWPGEDQAASFAPASAWILATAGTLSVSFSATNTNGLPEGRYVLSVTITPHTGGDPIEAYRCWIDLVLSSGSTTTLPTYCSYQDVLLYAAWIVKLQDDTDEAGFLRQRNRARQMLDNAIQKHYRYAGSWGIGSIGYEVAPSPAWGTLAYSPWLQTQLDNNLLQRRDGASPVHDGVVEEITAKWAIAMILNDALNPGDKEYSTYQVLAGRYQEEADNKLLSSVMRLDLNGDSWPELNIWMGVCSQRA